MAKEVEIKGARELSIKLDAVAHAIASNAYLMGQIGSFVELGILKRTAAGMDADNQPFPPYKPLYARRRKKAGRPVNKVDLFFTGSMLSALTWKAERDRVTLFFMNTTDRFGMKNAAKAYYNQQLRNFFAISAEDVREVEEIVHAHIRRHLKSKE